MNGSDEDFSIKGKKIQNLLGLQEITIGFIYSNQGRIIWNKNEKKFIIEGKNEFDLYHELGHLLLDSNPNHYSQSICDKTIFFAINTIIDAFNNYNLIYNIEITDYLELLYKGVKKQKKDILDKFAKRAKYYLLGDYIQFYLTSQFLFPKDEYYIPKKWNPFLQKLERRLNFQLSISKENLEMLKKELNKFEKRKKILDLRKIAEYSLNTIYVTELRNEKQLYNIIKKILL